MKCIECGSYNQGVTNSRVRGDVVKRTRVCNDCGARWNTIEKYVPQSQVKVRSRRKRKNEPK